MKKLSINIEEGGYQQDHNGRVKFVPFPGVRPLSDRVKRPRVTKKYDPKQGLLFDNGIRNCIGYIKKDE